jgi:hypothetical protein
MKHTKEHKRIIEFLDSLSKYEFEYLRLLISFALEVWRVQKKFEIPDKEMAKSLGWSKVKLGLVKKGAFNFSIKDIAQLEVLVRDEIEKGETIVLSSKDLREKGK